MFFFVWAIFAELLRRSIAVWHISIDEHTSCRKHVDSIAHISDAWYDLRDAASSRRDALVAFVVFITYVVYVIVCYSALSRLGHKRRWAVVLYGRNVLCLLQLQLHSYLFGTNCEKHDCSDGEHMLIWDYVCLQFSLICQFVFGRAALTVERSDDFSLSLSVPFGVI